MPALPIGHFGDRQGNQWFGLQGIGLARLDPATKKVSLWEPDSDSSVSLGAAFVYDVLEDSKSRFWVAHDGGLDLMDRGSGRFTHYLPDPTNEKALADGDIHHIVEDEGNLWVHSYDSGISHFDPDTGEFKNFPLTLSPVDGGGADRDIIRRGQLWWSSAHGLASFDFKRHVYRMHGIEQGIAQDPSDLGLLPDGRIALSYTGRVGIFDPSRLQADATAPLPVITRLRLGRHEILRSGNDAEYEIDGAPSVAMKLTVPHDHPALSIEFAALHFAGPQANKYALSAGGTRIGMDRN